MNSPNLSNPIHPENEINTSQNSGVHPISEISFHTQDRVTNLLNTSFTQVSKNLQNMSPEELEAIDREVDQQR